MTAPPQTPIAAAIDRLAYEAQYVRDVLHLAGPGAVCHVSAVSMQRLFDGLAQVLDILRGLPQVPAAPAGVPAPAPAQGGGG